MLADELVESKFDVKHILRELALSETYQRSSVIGGSADDIAAQSFAAANMKSLSAEQLAFSVMQATGSLKFVLTEPADKAATKKYRPDKGREIPAVNLDNVLKLFRSIYAAVPGQPEVEFAPSLAAALFVSNEKLLLQWLAAKDGNLISTNVLRSRGWCQRRSGPDGAPPVQFDHPVGQGPNLGFVM